MKGTVIFALLVMATLPSVAYAASLHCSPKQDDMASKRLEKATTLEEIYAISKSFPGCMTGGGMAEEVSDDVVVRLSRHWRNSLEALSKYEVSSDFIAFILENINGTTDPGDLRIILRNSKVACSPTSEALCRKIGAAANNGLREQ